MNIYHYNPDTYEYIGTNLAKESPLEPGKYLCPAYATFIEPPVVGDDHSVIFNLETQEWTEIVNYIGTKHYNKSDGVELVITELGEVVPDTSVLIQPSSSLYKPQWNGSEWIETALIFQGKVVETKADVDAITKMRINNLNEEKVKTEYMESIYNGTEVPSNWIIFMEQRAIILQEGDSFIAENSLV